MLRECISTLPGSCFESLNKQEFRGKFHAIYVQNLEHCFNPIQHQQFLGLLSDLLAENGRAYLMAQTFDGVDGAPGHPFQEFFNENKKNNILYPGFRQAIAHVRAVNMDENLKYVGYVHGNQRMTLTRPADTAECGNKESIDQSSTVMGVVRNTLVTLTDVKQTIIQNTFTKEVYEQAILRHPSARVRDSLKIVDSFYLGNKGIRYETYDHSKNTARVVAVIEKRSRSGEVAAPVAASSQGPIAP